MGAVNLVVQEALSVLAQVQVSQPVCNVVLGPVGQRLGGKRLCRGRGRQMRVTQARRWRERVQGWRGGPGQKVSWREGSRHN